MDDFIEQSKDVVDSKIEQSEDVVVSKEEEDVNLEWNDGDFCLFRPLKMSDISSGDVMSLGDNLIVIASTLKGDEEAKLLRLLLALRVKYWTLQPLCGVVSSFHSGFTNPAQLYTCLIDTTGPNDKKEKPKYLLCCLSTRGTGLELFREELDSFASTLAPSLQNLPTTVTSDSYIFQQLKSWTSALLYLSQIVLKYHDNLPTLLYAALNNSVNISGDNTVTVQELNRFINSCSVDILMQTQKTQLIDIDSDFDQPTVTIYITGSSLTISSQETNEFCKKWSKALLSRGVSEIDPFFLKRIIENHKLKIIQDMNALKRLVGDAERNYYTLYKCYTFLQATGNVDILLKCSLSEANSQDESETKSVLVALQEYISKKRSQNNKETTQPLIQL